MEESAVNWSNKLGLAAGLFSLLLAAPAARAQEASLKPVGIVSLASFNENLADVAYITRAAGMPDYGDTARFLVGAMSAGIDKARPIGMYFVPKQQEFHAVAFVPLDTNGLSTIFKVHKDQLGEPKDLGGGLYQVGRARTVFIKEQGGWGFVAEKQDFLTDLPQDPAAILGDLPAKYNIAAKLLVQNIPAEMRRMVIDQIKVGMERFLDSPAARQGSIDRQQAQQISAMYIQQIDRLLTESEELRLALAIDEPGKQIVLDIGAAAKEGTSLAKAMALQTEAKTNFAKFAQPGASVTMNMANKTGPEDIKQVKATIAAARVQWAKQIDDSPDIPGDKRDGLNSVLTQLFDLVEKTVESGRTDFAGALLLRPKAVSFTSSAYVADGAAFEQILTKLADLTKDLNNGPQFQLNAGKLGDLRLHRLKAAIPHGNAEAREVLGDSLDVVFAVGPTSVLVAGGKDADGLLRQVVTQNAQVHDQPTRPLEFVISLIPILQFSQSVKDNPIVKGILAGLEQSANDKIMITNDPGTRTSLTRVEVQEGVIKAIGEGAKAVGAGRRQPNF